MGVKLMKIPKLGQNSGKQGEIGGKLSENRGKFKRRKYKS